MDATARQHVLPAGKGYTADQLRDRVVQAHQSQGETMHRRLMLGRPALEDSDVARRWLAADRRRGFEGAG